MPRPGEVRVRAAAGQISELGHWLIEEYATTSREDAGVAIELGTSFLRRVRARPSSSLITVLVQRDYVDWLSRLSRTWHFADKGGRVTMHVPEGVRAAAVPFREAMRGRGRPALEHDQVEARAMGATAVEHRHKLRLKRRLRYEKAFRDWLDRGNTILGGPEPPPVY